MATASKHRSGVYWLPLQFPQQTDVASLAAGGLATNMVPLQDPVDSVNLRGTIVGGTITVHVRDAAAALLLASPTLIIGVWPASVTPIGGTNANVKEQEDYIWYRESMEPMWRHDALGSSSDWVCRIKLTTKRKVSQRGMRLGIGINNLDQTNAFGAAATLNIMLDLYLVLDA